MRSLTHSIACCTIIAGSTLLAACKPPPTDADMAREIPEEALTFASDPLPSPDTEGAMWAPTSRERLIYGIPGQSPLVAIECLEKGSDAPNIQITRLSPADEDASALLALVGNGHIGRIAVEAREVNGRSVWQGEALAADLLWEPLKGPRALGVTVPGAGRVEINPDTLPGLFIEICAFPPDQEPEPLEIQIPKLRDTRPGDDFIDAPAEPVDTAKPTTNEDAPPAL